MSDQQDHPESLALSDWTLVSSQGEIVSEDGDSESSGSSIEVVSLEGNEVVSRRLQRERSLGQDEAVVCNTALSVHPATEGNADFGTVSGGGDASGVQAADKEGSNVIQSEGSVLEASHGSQVSEDKEIYLVPSDEDTRGMQANVDFPERSPSPEMLNLPPENDTQEPEVLTEADSHSVGSDESCPTAAVDVPGSSVPGDGASICTYNLQSSQPQYTVLSSNLIDEPTPSAESPIEENPVTEPLPEESVEDGACCMELLAERGSEREGSEVPICETVDQGCPSPSPVDVHEAGISSLSGEGVSHSRGSSQRGDSDTDSDFVRLDSDSLDAYVGEQEEGHERVVIPLRLSSTGSSIGPSFSFMRNEDPAAGREVPGNNYVNDDGDDNVEGDADEDTESSNGDGVDDRIESEQSEAGSFSAQNDIGDLSVFADIGDLPLEAGDVRRNYIHRPNNHLSTVLNIIVVLAAILTMGISLGIIMATDLEIEEWQNAYEMQTKRVNQLELQLQGKTLSYDVQARKIKDLESRLQEMGNTISEMKMNAKNYKKAWRWLASDDLVQGGQMVKVLQLLESAVESYVTCEGENGPENAEDCSRELHPYVKIVTSLMEDQREAATPDDDSADESTSYEEELSYPQESVNVELDIDEEIIAPEEVEVADDDAKPEREDASTENVGSQDSGSRRFTVHESSHRLVTTEDVDHTHTSYEELREDDVEKPLVAEQAEPYVKKSAAEGRARVQALPIPLDIKQLQQSLTREQERALHWQQLYLAERRQRERERENEEWEDEREREMWEKEKERMDQLECLKKLMSTNLTTLTQHVVRWNVSVFDDFANLSMLLSGVAELQQSVVDTFQKAWEGAEEVLGKVYGNKEDVKSGSGNGWRNSIPDKDVIMNYVSKLVGSVKEGHMPDDKEMVKYLKRVLDDARAGVEGVLDGVKPEGLLDLAKRFREGAEEVITILHGNSEEKSEGQGWSDSKFYREKLVGYFAKMLSDISAGVGFVLAEVKPEGLEASSTDPGPVPVEMKGDYPESFHASVTPSNVEEGPFKSAHASAWPSNAEEGPFKRKEGDDYIFSEDYDSHQQAEEDEGKQGFWTKRIGKILKKTGRTVRKLGRKVAGTWSKIKSIWHERKPIWHKIKNVWHEKKPVVVNIAKHFTSKIMKWPSKLTNMCTRLSQKFFMKGGEELNAFDIHNKCVHETRKQWQKQVLKHPCGTLGKYSAECNRDRKQLKFDVYEISNSFNKLLNIRSIKPEKLFKMRRDKAQKILSHFQSFQQKWEGSKLLLESDLAWVDCQSNWWASAISAFHHKAINNLGSNECDKVQLQSTSEQYSKKNAHSEEHFSSRKPSTKENVPEAEDYHNEKGHFSFSDFDSLGGDTGKTVFSHDIGDNSHSAKGMDAEGNYTIEEDDASSDWYLERARYRLQLRREKEKADWQFDMAEDRARQRRSRWDNLAKDGIHGKASLQWVFLKAESRERQREEEHRADWYFNRVSDRKSKFTQKWMDDHTRRFKNRGHGFRYGKAKVFGSEEHHKDRMKDAEGEDYKKHHKAGQDKQFRHSYGKASFP